MNRKRQLAISLSAAVLSGMLVYGVYELQLRQVKLQETLEVVVPRQFVPMGATLSIEQLETRALPRSAVTEDMITDPLEAVGMETFAPLGAGEPLLRWKLDRFRLLPGIGEATFQIPREYVKSISSGIRAGDLAVVYLSDESSASRRLFEKPIVVAGVKTAANLEIDNPKNPNLLSMASGNKESMYASRRDANGTIDAINLNLTERQWLEIDSACKSGKAKLVVAFDSASLQQAPDKEAVTR
ncbi:flagellar biosynthesis protein FlgA [Cohnella sp. CFH 77786]|uniref:SAF domain-containing protein n=1 Tax=Cohnella sp. CFH 77786 TaxID=2662265 RepID=UPI001C60C78D|nr:SAF domain-containing protein [Cohnella sp. CFH 77786]MBW5449406.1 flagellar biosynthesis protein FlgA [Cohnella sp. CFH 77786]